jgi:hypothetical protein
MIFRIDCIRPPVDNDGLKILYEIDTFVNDKAAIFCIIQLMNSRTHKDLLIIAVFLLALLLPFAAKPFNVDDPFYIKMAQQIASDPLRPYSFSINWSGQLRNVWDKTEATFPPLIPYYIALIIKVFGLNEKILHLFFLIFPLSAAAGLYFILKKYTESPLLLTLTAIATPAFLVSSTGIMLDLPLAALMLSSIALFIYGLDEEKVSFLAASSVLAGLAVLAKYSGMLLVPLFIAGLIIKKKMKFAWCLAVPAGFFGLWCLHNELIYGGIHFFRSSLHVGKGISLHKLVSAPLFFSGALIFPLLSFLAAKRREAAGICVLALTLLVLSFAVIGGLPASFLAALFFSSTLYFFYKTVKLRSAIDPFILAWLVLSAGLILFVEPWVSGRYILVILPPAIIIFGRMIDRFRAALALTLAFGLLLAVADYRWAGVYPKTAEYIKSEYGGPAPGQAVYFTGHFGFQYYMEKAGMKALETDKGIPGAAFLAVSMLADPQKPGQELMKKLEFLELRKADDGMPARIMGPKCRAGFYSSLWGILPFNFSAEPLEEFAVFKVRK